MQIRRYDQVKRPEFCKIQCLGTFQSERRGRVNIDVLLSLIICYYHERIANVLLSGSNYTPLGRDCQPQTLRRNGFHRRATRPWYVPVQRQIILGNFVRCVGEVDQGRGDRHAPTQIHGRFRRIGLESHGIILFPTQGRRLRKGSPFISRAAAISYSFPSAGGRYGIAASVRWSLNDVCQFQRLAGREQARTGCEQQHHDALPLCCGTERPHLSLFVTFGLAQCRTGILGITMQKLCKFVAVLQVLLFVGRFLRRSAMPPYPRPHGVMERRRYGAKHRCGSLYHIVGLSES